MDALLRATAAPAPLEELETAPGIADPSELDPFEKVAGDHLRQTLDDMLAELGQKPGRIERLRYRVGVAESLTLE